MAKGQMRKPKEAKKPKTAEKKKGPKYLMGGTIGQAAKPASPPPGQKK